MINIKIYHPPSQAPQFTLKDNIHKTVYERKANISLVFTRLN